MNPTLLCPHPPYSKAGRFLTATSASHGHPACDISYRGFEENRIQISTAAMTSERGHQNDGLYHNHPLHGTFGQYCITSSDTDGISRMGSSVNISPDSSVEEIDVRPIRERPDRLRQTCDISSAGVDASSHIVDLEVPSATAIGLRRRDLNSGTHSRVSP